MGSNKIATTRQAHNVVLVCDKCPHHYRSTFSSSRTLFGLAIRNNLSNKPDVENQTLNSYEARLQIWVLKIKVLTSRIFFNVAL